MSYVARVGLFRSHALQVGGLGFRLKIGTSLKRQLVYVGRYGLGEITRFGTINSEWLLRYYVTDLASCQNRDRQTLGRCQPLSRQL